MKILPLVSLSVILTLGAMVLAESLARHFLGTRAATAAAERRTVDLSEGTAELLWSRRDPGPWGGWISHTVLQEERGGRYFAIADESGVIRVSVGHLPPPAGTMGVALD